MKNFEFLHSNEAWRHKQSRGSRCCVYCHYYIVEWSELQLIMLEYLASYIPDGLLICHYVLLMMLITNSDHDVRQ